MRVSAEEYDPLGNHPQDIVRILKELSGIDLIDVSSGGVTDFKVNSYPAYQIPYSETIKKLANLPTAAGGLITDAKQAETVLKEGKADLIYFGRELLRNPYFPLHAAKALGTEIIGRNNISAHKKINTEHLLGIFKSTSLFPIKSIKFRPGFGLCF